MKTKPKLSFWQIWNMSFGFLGIQFGFALQNANVSRIFETLGANIDNIPILWIAAPVTGLIIQPIIGHWSDRTWGKLGRRRPFFLIGAVLASIALLIMPNSPALWIAAGMLWIMDASINVSMEPFRAFVGDMLPSEQRTTGFAMQSFFIGTGAVIASLLPYMMTNWFGISNTAAEGQIPDSVKFSFYIGAAVFITAVSWTVFRTKEYSPEELKEFEDIKEDVKEADDQVNIKVNLKRSYKLGLMFLVLGIILSVLFYFIDVEKEVYILSFGLILFGILEVLSGTIQKAGKSTGFTSIFNDLNSMPLTMKQLAIVQFFSWFALFAMWIYTTNGITADKYNMKIDQEMVDLLKSELNIFKIKIDKEKEEIKEIAHKLEPYKKKIAEQSVVNIDINLLKYFWKNKIFNKKGFIKKLTEGKSSYSTDNKDIIIDEEIIIFLQSEVSIIRNNNFDEFEKIEEIANELETYVIKISKQGIVSANVNLVKFFLNNKLYNEKELVKELTNSLQSYVSNDKTFEAAIKELKQLSSEKKPDISFQTTSLINTLLSENKINISSSSEKFSKFTRLKEIRDEYNKGANWVGVGFGVYNGFAAVFAFLLILLARITSRKITHMISLLVGGLSFIMIFFVNDTSYMLLVPFIGIGLAWASILAMPYAILTGSLPTNKMGVYMGIFNFFIVIPQILAASILGFLVKSVFEGEAIYALILGGISLVIAAFLVLIVKDDN